MKKSLLLSFTLMLASSLVCVNAAAQDVPDAIINVDGVGFARMIEGEFVAFDLVAAYDEHSIVEANCSQFKARAKGVDWCFSSAQNQATFESATQDNGSNPYIPFVGGHCALGMSFGNLAARGDPRTAVRIGNQLVLNGRLEVRTTFLEDTERHMDNGRLRYEMAIANGSLKVND